jgi:uncharacterized membrane protein
VRRWGFVPIVLLGAGAGLVLLALLEGGAHLALIVVIPVFFGGSLEFVLGVLLLVGGFVGLPLAFDGESVPTSGRGTTTGGSGSSGSGGLVLIGPIPIFIGRWKSVSGRARLAAALVGAAIVAIAVVTIVVYRV